MEISKASNQRRTTSCFLPKFLRWFVLILVTLSGLLVVLFRNSESWANISSQYSEVLSMKEKTSDVIIPHTLIFAAESNILTTKEPKHVYGNIKNTIHAYTMAFKDPIMQHHNILFLNDNICRLEIETAYEGLLPYYQNRSSLICIIAALYNQGGYYFNVTDLYTIEPLVFDDTSVSLARAYKLPTYKLPTGGFAPSFLASQPKHPILKQVLEELFILYRGHNTTIGTSHHAVFQRAYNKTAENKRGTTRLFKEINSDVMRQEFKDRNGFNSTCCNHFVVYEPETDVAHFFSQIGEHGISFCCVNYLKNHHPHLIVNEQEQD